jgi:hypothetical protein
VAVNPKPTQTKKKNTEFKELGLTQSTVVHKQKLMGFFGFLHGLKEWLQKSSLIDSSFSST